jgi:hypothetical protein
LKVEDTPPKRRTTMRTLDFMFGPETVYSDCVCRGCPKFLDLLHAHLISSLSPITIFDSV